MPSRPRVHHILKCWPEFFQPTLNGLKRFELRRDDRPEGFQVGDELLQREWDPVKFNDLLSHYNEPGPVDEVREQFIQACYTGREVLVRVDYVMDARMADRLMGVLCRTGAPGYVIMSVSLVN